LHLGLIFFRPFGACSPYLLTQGEGRKTCPSPWAVIFRRFAAWCIPHLPTTIGRETARTSVLLRRPRRSIGPLGDRNQKRGQSLLRVSKCHHYRRARQARSPGYCLC